MVESPDEADSWSESVREPGLVSDEKWTLLVLPFRKIDFMTGVAGSSGLEEQSIVVYREVL